MLFLIVAVQLNPLQRGGGNTVYILLLCLDFQDYYLNFNFYVNLTQN